MLRQTPFQLRAFKGVLRRHHRSPEGLPEYLHMSKQWLRRDGERWWVIDAKGQQLQDVARCASFYATGQNRPDFTPGTIAGDHVVVLNCKDVVMVGDQWIRVPITWNSAYPSGKYRVRAVDMFERDPCMLVFNSVRENVTHNFGRKLKTRCAPLENVWLYEDAVHPHQEKGLRPVSWNAAVDPMQWKSPANEVRWTPNSFMM